MGMKKEIIIAVTGLTPQVITETLYYLIQVKKPRSRISEIHVLTTLDGKREVVTKLLERDKGKFFEFCKDYNINPSSIEFNQGSITLLRDSAGNPLQDIRTPEDNEAVADQITEFIREKTSNENSILHCSIAGGRKTMSVYLACALMLFGRPRDTLSHVLADERSERDKMFFYPPKSSRKSGVELAEIPYLRLRDRMKNLFGSEKLSFSRMVKVAQREIDAMPLLKNLEVNLKKRCLIIGEMRINLKPKHIALYAHYAERRRALPNKTCFEPLKGANSITNHLDKIRNYIKDMLPEANLEKYRFSRENILQDISKINKQIEDVLADPALAFYYRITSAELRPTYGATKYGIHIDRSKIKPLILP